MHAGELLVRISRAERAQLVAQKIFEAFRAGGEIGSRRVAHVSRDPCRKRRNCVRAEIDVRAEPMIVGHEMQRGAVRAREIDAPHRPGTARRSSHAPSRSARRRRRSGAIAGNLERQREQEDARARVFERCEAGHERAHAGAAEHDAALAGRVRERASDARVDRARILARVDVEIVGPHAVPAERVGDFRRARSPWSHSGRFRGRGRG